jgi:hypothetical protein
MAFTTSLERPVKRALERVRELEHPAIDLLTRILEPKTPCSYATKLAAAKNVPDRTGHQAMNKVEVASPQNGRRQEALDATLAPAESPTRSDREARAASDGRGRLGVSCPNRN